jgi:hypothetical protein
LNKLLAISNTDDKQPNAINNCIECRMGQIVGGARNIPSARSICNMSKKNLALEEKNKTITITPARIRVVWSNFIFYVE